MREVDNERTFRIDDHVRVESRSDVIGAGARSRPGRFEDAPGWLPLAEIGGHERALSVPRVDDQPVPISEREHVRTFMPTGRGEYAARAVPGVQVGAIAGPSRVEECFILVPHPEAAAGQRKDTRVDDKVALQVLSLIHI